VVSNQEDSTPFFVDLRHGPGSQVLWTRGSANLGLSGELKLTTDGPVAGAGLPSRLVLAGLRPLSFSGGQVSAGTPSRPPGSNATLSLAAKNQFTVTNDFVQGPGNQIRGTEGAALTIAGQGSIDGGSLIAGPGGALPARQCRPVV
jgi:hypothetical protein